MRTRTTAVDVLSAGAAWAVHQASSSGSQDGGVSGRAIVDAEIWLGASRCVVGAAPSPSRPSPALSPPVHAARASTPTTTQLLIDPRPYRLGPQRRARPKHDDLHSADRDADRRTRYGRYEGWSNVEPPGCPLTADHPALFTRRSHGEHDGATAC
ncbi:MAG: hypothetical protein CL424_07885 [Acidimicrobiaceae bacterium]|nr:hypothetical protein [Acidimicrobiaceae bacterium]